MAVVKKFGIVSFSVEFHKFIKVANCFVILSKYSKHVQIVVTKKSIEITASNDLKYSPGCRFEMPIDTFVPPSLSGLSGNFWKSTRNKENDGISYETVSECKRSPIEITFRLDVMDEVFDDDERENSKNAYLPPIKNETEYNLYCKFCNSKINKDSLVFKRILEKPSSDWQDLASEWFCHRHGDDDDVPKGIKPTDMMFCSTSVYIYPDLLTFKSDTDNSILCTRCDAILGDFSVSRLLSENDTLVLAELMRHCICFIPLDDKVTSMRPTDYEECGDAVMAVVKMIQEQIGPTLMCKLCIDSKGLNPNGSLLLWVMDGTLLRFNTLLPLSLKILTTPIRLQKVIRVLYGLSDGQSPLAVCWRKDFAVETQTLEDSALWSVADHLLNSTQTLTSAHRQLDDLWVGYLPK